MSTNTKHTYNKSCSCDACMAGRGSEAGNVTQKRNERKLRRQAKRAIQRYMNGEDDDVDIFPLSSPYTD